MHTYEEDIYAWSKEQAHLLRAGRFDVLDVERVAQEIEDVAKSERRELANCLVALIALLLKWRFQADRRGPRLERAIKAERIAVVYLLVESPSLRGTLQETQWLEVVWARAIAQAVSDTGLDCFPDECPWAIPDEVLRDAWLPD